MPVALAKKRRSICGWGRLRVHLVGDLERLFDCNFFLWSGSGMCPGELDVSAEDFGTGLDATRSARVLDNVGQDLLWLAAAKCGIIPCGLVFSEAPGGDLSGPCSADLGALISSGGGPSAVVQVLRGNWCRIRRRDSLKAAMSPTGDAGSPCGRTWGLVGRSAVCGPASSHRLWLVQTARKGWRTWCGSCIRSRASMAFRAARRSKALLRSAEPKNCLPPGAGLVS